MKKTIFFLLVLFSLTLAACGAQPAPTAETPTIVDDTVVAEGQYL